MPSCGVRLSVRLSVWVSARSCILSKRVNLLSNLFHRPVATPLASKYNVTLKTGLGSFKVIENGTVR